jgi:hypothetical protein
MWQTDEPSYIRKDAAVPEALAATDHVPAIVVTAPDVVRNVDGSVIVHSVPDGSDAAQLAGSAPLNIFSVPDEPIAV